MDGGVRNPRSIEVNCHEKPPSFARPVWQTKEMQTALKREPLRAPPAHGVRQQRDPGPLGARAKRVVCARIINASIINVSSSSGANGTNGANGANGTSGASGASSGAIGASSARPKEQAIRPPRQHPQVLACSLAHHAMRGAYDGRATDPHRNDRSAGVPHNNVEDPRILAHGRGAPGVGVRDGIADDDEREAAREGWGRSEIGTDVLAEVLRAHGGVQLAKQPRGGLGGRTDRGSAAHTHIYDHI
jgi:hypothetical protein